MLNRLRSLARRWGFSGKRVHLVVERGGKLAGAMDDIKSAKSLTAAYLSAKDAGAGIAGVRDCGLYSPDIVPGNSEAFDEVVKKANVLSSAAVEALIAVLGESRIGNLLREYHYAMYLGLRANLITVLTMIRAAEGGARLRTWDKLIVVCNTREFLLTLLPAFRTAYGKEKVLALMEGAFVGDVEAGVPGGPGSDQRDAPEPFHSCPSGEGVKAFEDAVLGVPILTLPQRLDSYALFVIRSSLKTVPSTVLPLMRRLRRKADIVVVDRGAGSSAFNAVQCSSEDRTFLRDSVYLYDVSELQSGSRIVDEVVLRSFTDAICGKLREQDLLAWDNIDLEPSIAGVVYRYVARTVPAMVLKIRSFERFFSVNRNGVVVACPGRTAEAAAAEGAARKYGVRSIDVMNAYMSYGYTYAAPHSDFVSVIDAWSRDLCVQRYGIPEDRVLICGTPRFDRVPLQEAQSGDKVLNAGDGTAERRIVLATQPGVRRQIVRIINELARLDDARGAIRIILKLHPMETRQDETAYVEAIARAASRHRFELVRDRDIYEVMRDADAIVVLFSNVGVEAALMDLPVVIAKMGWSELPLPLDEMGVGITAETGEELRSAVLGMLHDEEARERARGIRREFIRRNPILAQRKSTDRLVEAIGSLMNGVRAGDESRDITGACAG